MDPTEVVTTYLLFSVMGGLAGAAVMLVVMRLIDRNGPSGRNMIDAVGSLLTRNRENSRLVGALLHGVAAIGYGLIYTVLLMALNMTDWPDGLLAGFGLGTFHGIVVSLALVWVIADQHPLPEFRDTGATVFLSHLAGHIAYGTVMGAVVAWSPL